MFTSLVQVGLCAVWHAAGGHAAAPLLMPAVAPPPPPRLLDPAHDFDGLLHWFRRTKQLVDAKGPLPTSRQEARARQRQQRGQRSGSSQAAGNDSSRKQAAEQQAGELHTHQQGIVTRAQADVIFRTCTLNRVSRCG